MILTAATMFSTLYNVKKLGFYSECMGRQVEFLLLLPNFFEERPYEVNRIDLPLLSPFRMLLNLQNLAFVLIVPLFYTLIYRFRKNHDKRITGIIFISISVYYYFVNTQIQLFLKLNNIFFENIFILMRL